MNLDPEITREITPEITYCIELSDELSKYSFCLNFEVNNYSEIHTEGQFLECMMISQKMDLYLRHPKLQ